MVKAIPDEYNRVQPYLIVAGAAKLIDFLTQTVGATERMRMPQPDGSIGHAEVTIGDSVIMLSDSNAQFPPSPASMVVYVEDCDGAYKKALAAGATSEQEPVDQFYGDRTCTVRDPFGNRWMFHTHIEDVSPDEMGKRAAEAAARS